MTFLDCEYFEQLKIGGISIVTLISIHSHKHKEQTYHFALDLYSMM